MAIKLTRKKVPVEQVLQGAQECTTVFLLGLDKDGNLYAASSTADASECIWLYERWKSRLFADEPAWAE